MPSRPQKQRAHRESSRSREASIPISQPQEDSDPAPAKSDANVGNPAPAAPHGVIAQKSKGAAMEEARYNPYANFQESANGKIPTTIRTVPSFESPSDASSDSPSTRNSAFSSSVNSNTSGASYLSQAQSQNGAAARFKPKGGGTEVHSARSGARGSQMSSSDATPKARDGAPEAEHAADASIVEEQAAVRDTNPQWDGTVGRAALGKTGRVINKLVSDNEALKRDIKVERMKSEEAKQAAKLMEDKMERMISDYESRLLEANVTKTLLSRKERQVESFQAAVELEKKRTADAVERERTWRDELEKSRKDANTQVEEAKAHAALMEGRYNAIASHWKDQGVEVNRVTANVRKDIASLVEERRKDDEKITTLRDICDQQDANIKDLKRQKDEIGVHFENYKNVQENLLQDIKRKATERETEQERTLAETQKVLGELRWALNIKKNVSGAG